MICLAVLEIERVPVLFGVQETACCRQHHVLHIAFQFNLIGAVTTRIDLTVRAVAAYDAQFGFRDRVTLLVFHCALRKELHLRQGEAVDLVVTFLVAFVRAEKAVLRVTGKRDSEIIACAVERRSHVV